MTTLSRRAAIAGSTAAIIARAAHSADTPAVVQVAEGLRFPEGPVAMPDGSVVLCEIAAGQITRVKPDGGKTVVAKTGGGPNGAAIGHDGALYVANNGGFSWTESEAGLFPTLEASDYAGGRIERVDLHSGKVTVLYKAADGPPLVGPNDVVVDAAGGLWITDAGQSTETARLNGAIFYATPDGRSIKRVIYPLATPNGIGLSPDGKTLYVSLTSERNVLAFDIGAPGEIKSSGPLPGRVIATAPGRNDLDSLRVDGAGNICVAVLVEKPGIRTYSVDGRDLGTVPVPDFIPTSLCFGGKDLRDVHITGGTRGHLFRTTWVQPGLKLNFQQV